MPAMTILFYILRKWLASPIAFALSVGLLLLSFSLFDRRFSFKRFAVIVLLFFLAAYLYAAFLKL